MRLLTPRGIGGIAVVCAAPGAERAALLACLRTAAGAGVAIAPGDPPRRCTLHWDGLPRDEVLAVDRPAGLELHLHGSPALLDALAARFGAFTAASETPAARLLRTALSSSQLDLALEQLALDFDAFLAAAVALPLAAQRPRLAAALQRSAAAVALAAPHRVVLIGRQNAGKSTLFNRLLFSERALTGPLPGLTRDPLREVTTLDGYPYELIDTAGVGAAGAPIDVAAQAAGRAERADADCLLVIDAAAGPAPADRELCSPRALVLASKCDLPPAPWPPDFPCDLRLACREPAAAAAVRAAVGDALRRRRGLPPAGPVGGPAALDGEQLHALRRAAGAAGLEPA